VSASCGTTPANVSADAPSEAVPIAAPLAKERRRRRQCFSITASDAKCLSALRVEDPQHLQQAFVTAALRALFAAPLGRKLTAANLSGHLSLQDDAQGFTAVGRSAFGTCGVFGSHINSFGLGGSGGGGGAGGGGKWYYEVQILSFGKNHFCQMGWGTEEGTFNNDSHLGVGDEKGSWSFCGKRHLKYNAGSCAATVWLPS
jgi:hypothetical protein